jgi:hypothetical protein
MQPIISHAEGRWQGVGSKSLKNLNDSPQVWGTAVFRRPATSKGVIGCNSNLIHPAKTMGTTASWRISKNGRRGAADWGLYHELLELQLIAKNPKKPSRPFGARKDFYEF